MQTRLLRAVESVECGSLALNGCFGPMSLPTELLPAESLTQLSLQPELIPMSVFTNFLLSVPVSFPSLQSLRARIGCSEVDWSTVIGQITAVRPIAVKHVDLSFYEIADSRAWEMALGGLFGVLHLARRVVVRCHYAVAAASHIAHLVHTYLQAYQSIPCNRATFKLYLDYRSRAYHVSVFSALHASVGESGGFEGVTDSVMSSSAGQCGQILGQQMVDAIQQTRSTIKSVQCYMKHASYQANIRIHVALAHKMFCIDLIC